MLLHSLLHAFAITAAEAVSPPQPFFDTPVKLGEYRITRNFGYGLDPFTGRVSFHAGQDYAGPYGALISAAAEGVVTVAGQSGPYGLLIEIDHGYGYKTRYGHLASVHVGAGEAVRAGQMIGQMGSSGRSTGPHLHFEVWIGDTAKDPKVHLRPIRMSPVVPD